MLLYSLILPAQNHDYYWVMGYGSNIVGGNSGGTDIDFNVSPPDTNYVFREMDMQENCTSICNAEGELLFYSNGCYIAASDHLPLLNGDGLNPGFIADNYCDIAYLGAQCSIILPMPEVDSLYRLFHLTIDLNDLNAGVVTKFLYTDINMNLDNERGAVTVKNQLILEDTLTFGQLTAVKHANGKDWWVVIPESTSDRYYKYLFTSNGLLGPFEQRIGNVSSSVDWNGQAVFSPDGNTYVRFDTYNDLNIFDFDRCEGTISNHRYIPMNFNMDTVVAGGAAISSNSQYLYVSATDKVFQFDLYANDIASSKTVVAIYDGYASPFASTFYLAQLAADNKIYINCTNAENVLHVINEPNLPGLDCNLTQHSFQLPTYNGFSMPNFPNYRLGQSSEVCDSVIANTVFPDSLAITIRAFPNPVSEQINFDNVPGRFEKGIVYFYDVAGREVAKYNILPGEASFSLDMEHFMPGCYIYNVMLDDVLQSSGKVIKQ